MPKTDHQHLDEQHANALHLLHVDGWNPATIRIIIAAALVCGHRVGFGRGKNAGPAAAVNEAPSRREVTAFDAGYDAGLAKGRAEALGVRIYSPSAN